MSKVSSTSQSSLDMATNLAKKLNDQETSTTLSKPKKKINGIKKGKQFEREIANRLGHIFPEAERMLEYQASKVIGVDIEGTDRIKIQCKNHQNYCSIGTIHEVKIKDPNDIPVLVTKGIRMEAMAVLPFEKFVTLLEIAYGLELPFRSFDTSVVDCNVKLVSPPTYGPKKGNPSYFQREEVKEIEYSETPRYFSEIFSESELAEMALEDSEEEVDREFTGDSGFDVEIYIEEAERADALYTLKDLDSLI